MKRKVIALIIAAVMSLVIMNPGRMLDKAAETGAVFYADGKKADNMGRVSFEVSFDKAALAIYQIYLIPSGSGETYTQEVTYLMGDFDKRFLEKINGDDGATTEGIKAVMTSDDAKKLYTNCTAAVLRAKSCVMKTATSVQENAGDILAEAKQINEDRAAEAEAEVVDDFCETEETAEDTAEATEE